MGDVYTRFDEVWSMHYAEVACIVMNVLHVSRLDTSGIGLRVQWAQDYNGQRIRCKLHTVCVVSSLRRMQDFERGRD